MSETYLVRRNVLLDRRWIRRDSLPISDKGGECEQETPKKWHSRCGKKKKFAVDIVCEIQSQLATRTACRSVVKCLFQKSKNYGLVIKLFF